MSLHPDWLSEVRSNPYADQLSKGFRRLMFSAELEQEYRGFLLCESFELRRLALVFALCVWLSFIFLDLWRVDGPLLLMILSIRLGVASLLLASGWVVLTQRYFRYASGLSIACIASLGVGTAAIIALGHRYAPVFPYEGMLLVCIAAYFLVGLRLFEAAITAFLIVLAYGLFEWFAGLEPQRLLNNLIFLLVGNLIGAVGCYVLELKSREHFLISQLLGVLVHRDSLTGLHNRRSFDRELVRLWRQAQREGQSLALLLCDVDYFKAYNDRYGHQAGDSALQQVGYVLQNAARRPLDMAVRLGGEEFVVLLYGMQIEEARQQAETLRQALEDLAIEHGDSLTAPVLTLSIGVACVWPQVGQDPFSLCAHADRMLYVAKASGRNQVMT